MIQYKVTDKGTVVTALHHNDSYDIILEPGSIINYDEETRNMYYKHYLLSDYLSFHLKHGYIELNT